MVDPVLTVTDSILDDVLPHLCGRQVPFRLLASLAGCPEDDAGGYRVKLSAAHDPVRRWTLCIRLESPWRSAVRTLARMPDGIGLVLRQDNLVHWPGEALSLLRTQVRAGLLLAEMGVPLRGLSVRVAGSATPRAPGYGRSLALTGFLPPDWDGKACEGFFPLVRSGGPVRQLEALCEQADTTARRPGDSDLVLPELAEERFLLSDGELRLAEGYASRPGRPLPERPLGPGVVIRRDGDGGAEDVLLPPGNLGLGRDQMAQIAQARIPDLLAWLRGQGVSWEEVALPANALLGSQKEINPVKARKMAADQSPAELAKLPLLTSADNYVADGHHRWVALWYHGPDTPCPCYRFGLPIRDLLAKLKEFPDSFTSTTFAAPDAAPDDGDYQVGRVGPEGDHWLAGFMGDLHGWTDALAEGRWCPELFTAVCAARLGLHQHQVAYRWLDGADSPGDRAARADLLAQWRHAGHPWVRLTEGLPLTDWDQSFRGRLVSFAEGGGSLHLRPAGWYDPRDPDRRHGEPARRLAAMLRHRLRHRFGPDEASQAEQLLREAPDHETAVQAYRILVRGGHEPRDRHEAGILLRRALQRLPRYEDADGAVRVGRERQATSWPERLAADHTDQLQVAALARFQSGTLAADRAANFQGAAAMLRGLLATGRPGEPEGDREDATGWRQVMVQARTLRRQQECQSGLARAHLLEMLLPARRLTLRLHWDTSLAGGLRRSSQEAVFFTCALTALGADERGEPLLRLLRQGPAYQRTEFVPGPGGGAATVRLAASESTGGVVHALGHSLEWLLPGLKRAALGFLSYRCGRHGLLGPGVPPDLEPGGLAVRGESGRAFSWDAFFTGTDALYVGKVMPVGSGTEVTAMLLEALWRDPSGLASHDPEACQWILGVLRGDFRRT